MTSSEQLSLSLAIGLDAIVSYKRLSYTAWHAIAEFVDNSTQAYFDNRDELDAAYAEERDGLEVSITYDRDHSVLRIADNSIGMSFADLERAMHIARPPAKPTGRSRYGMGLKTAACWIGDQWRLRTKRLGETVEHVVTVDVDAIIGGNHDLNYQSKEGKDPTLHYTVVEIAEHNQVFQGRTLGKMKQHLRSMYRADLSDGILTLKFNGEELSWEGFEDQLLKAHDGELYKREFEFLVNGKAVRGWVGILDRGSRSKAGFSILHSRRVVLGWPNAWRPTTLYGQDQGSNDLVNQRLIGEVHLDEFEVNHTKDGISWTGTELEEVEDELLGHCSEYREIAKRPRKGTDDERGPSQVDIDVAIDEFQRELESPQLLDRIRLDEVPSPELSEEAFRGILETADARPEPAFHVEIDSVSVRGYVASDLSSNDPYVSIDVARGEELVVIINMQHPHISYVDGSMGLVNYFRYCTYDAVSEWKALRKASSVNSDTIRLIKDGLLRTRFELDMSVGADGTEDAEEEAES